MQLFNLVRDTDVVAQGVEYDDGTCAMRWLAGTASTAVYGSLADVENIHGHGGATRVEVQEEGLELVLGWSNPDTGPLSHRLYALDQGQSPRWASPHARVAEQPLEERGDLEGDVYRLVRAGKRRG